MTNETNDPRTDEERAVDAAERRIEGDHVQAETGNGTAAQIATGDTAPTPTPQSEPPIVDPVAHERLHEVADDREARKDDSVPRA